MRTFQSWFFRILWWLTFVAIVLVVIVIVNREWIARELVERQIRNITGMEPEMHGFSFGMLDSKVTLNSFRLHNTAEFGGTLLLDAPEVHIEYDRDALRRHEIHIKLMRMDINELDVVKNDAGATNIMSLINAMAPRKSGGGSRAFAPLNGYKFTGIDLLNISIGTVKFVDLKDQRRNRMVAIGIENQIYNNVMSPADLHGLSGQLWVRGGYMVGLPVNPPIHEASSEPAPTSP
jgi:hypothetical protein